MLIGSRERTGVDIGAGGIKVVRALTGSKPRLLSAALVEFSPAQTAQDLDADLASLAAAKKLGTRGVVTQIPAKDLTIRSLTLPRMPVSELREAVRWEAKRHISYPLDTALVEFLVTGEQTVEGVEKLDVLLVAAEEGIVQQHLAPFRKVGITVTAVDANALALRNDLDRRNAFPDEEMLVVDLGAAKTEIDIFKGRVLRFSRSIEIGGLAMTRAIAEARQMGLQEAEELKRTLDIEAPPESDPAIAAALGLLDGILMEIRRSQEYYKTTCRAPGCGRAIVTGGVASLRGLPAYFSRALDLPVELDDPFMLYPCATGVREQYGPLGPRFSAAVGLALRTH